MPGKCKAGWEPAHSREEAWPFWEEALRQRWKAWGGAHSVSRCPAVLGGSWNSRRPGLVLRVHEVMEELRNQRDQPSGCRCSTSTDPMGSRMTLPMELTTLRPLAGPRPLLDCISRDLSLASENCRLCDHPSMTVSTVRGALSVL